MSVKQYHSNIIAYVTKRFPKITAYGFILGIIPFLFVAVFVCFFACLIGFCSSFHLSIDLNLSQAY